MSNHGAWMDEALQEAHKAAAHGDVPVGAVLIQGNRILARGHNRREVDGDPTAHAEMLVLREAAATGADWRLTDCTMVVTLEPCPMCASAIRQARIRTVIYGADDPVQGAAGSRYQLLSDAIPLPPVTVYGGIREHACRELLESFFAARRHFGGVSEPG